MFALAKAYEDRDDYETAWKWYEDKLGELIEVLEPVEAIELGRVLVQPREVGVRAVVGSRARVEQLGSGGPDAGA